MRFATIAAVAIALAFAAPSAAQEAIEGTALALDGDTLLVTPEGGKPVKVRLWAVDAPEMKVIPWGPFARVALDSWLKSSKGRVSCERRGRSHDRIVGLCLIPMPDGGRVDLGERLIREGFAVEHRAFGGGFYQEAEFEAAMNAVGFWNVPLKVAPAPK